MDRPNILDNGIVRSMTNDELEQYNRDIAAAPVEPSAE